MEANTRRTALRYVLGPNVTSFQNDGRLILEVDLAGQAPLSKSGKAHLIANLPWTPIPGQPDTAIQMIISRRRSFSPEGGILL